MNQKHSGNLHFRELVKRRVSLRARSLWILAIIVVAICTAAGLTLRTNKIKAFADVGEMKGRPAVEAPAMPEPVVPMQAAIPEEAELLILTPEGFIPAAITRTSGPFLLEVIDRSGLDQITLQLNSEGGANLQSSKSEIQKAQAQNVLNLPVGTYVYTEASHPEWSCTITVTP